MRMSLAETVESAQARPCPFCGAVALTYTFAPSEWTCGNCGTEGIASTVNLPGMRALGKRTGRLYRPEFSIERDDL